MEKRSKQIKDLQIYVQEIDKELTMILQRLHWGRGHLLEKNALVSCKYNTSHKMSQLKQDIHENECFLKAQGYIKTDILLPDPVNSYSNTVVKLDNEAISKIINNASILDPHFNKGHRGTEPMTLDRLQSTYTTDERRAIHDAVVSAVPSCHDLADLALPSVRNNEQQPSETKSRTEILAELRDMKRRRAKYRVAAKTNNYSDVLRDVIKTQMELYTEAKIESVSTCNIIDNGSTNKYVDDNCLYNRIQNKYDLHNKDRRMDRHSDRKEPHRDRADSKDRSRKEISQQKHGVLYSSRENLRTNSSTDSKYKYYDVDRRKRDRERYRYMNSSKEGSRHYHQTRTGSEEFEGNSSKYRSLKDSYLSRDKYKEKYSDNTERADKDEQHKRYDEVYHENDNGKRKRYQ